MKKQIFFALLVNVRKPYKIHRERENKEVSENLLHIRRVLRKKKYRCQSRQGAEKVKKHVFRGNEIGYPTVRHNYGANDKDGDKERRNVGTYQRNPFDNLLRKIKHRILCPYQYYQHPERPKCGIIIFNANTLHGGYLCNLSENYFLFPLFTILIKTPIFLKYLPVWCARWLGK